MKVAAKEFNKDLATYELAYADGAMLAFVKEQAWIENKPFNLNGEKFSPGKRFTQIGGKRKATTFEMQDGHWLEYCGRIDDLLLFKPDSTDLDGWFYAFFQAVERLFITDLKGNGADFW